MLTLLIDSENIASLITFIESEILPKIKEGYWSGALWCIEADEEGEIDNEE